MRSTLNLGLHKPVILRAVLLPSKSTYASEVVLIIPGERTGDGTAVMRYSLQTAQVALRDGSNEEEKYPYKARKCI